MSAPQVADSKPGAYYVSIMRDDGRYILAAGPYYNDHQAALDRVDEVRRVAYELDPRAHWYAFGTCRIPDDQPAQVGKLNEYLA